MAFVQDGELKFSEYMQKTGFWDKIKNFFRNLGNRYAGTGLTSAENEANAFTHNERLESQDFNAAEAQKSRDFTEYMTRNKYAMETQSMEDAGINPAMVYGGGSLVPTAANGAAASSSPGSSVSPNSLNPLDMILSLVRFPREMENLRAEISERRASASQSRDLGRAALYNAETNRIMATTGQGELGVHQKLADLKEIEVGISKALAASNIEVNDQEKQKIAAQTAQIQTDTDMMPKRLAVAERNASANEKQAMASLRTSLAAVQNAATNDRLADYQTDLMYAQAYVEWANKEGKEIINKYLEPRQIKELENLGKQGQLYDTQRHFLISQQVSNYVNAACNVSNAVNKWVNPLAGIGSGTSAASPAPISPDMLYGNFGTYYGN